MKLLYDLISGFAKLRPDKIAIMDKYGEISYDSLIGMSGAVAATLTDMEVRENDAVAIYMPYVKDVLPAIIAVLRTGGIYVPFDEEYPVNRLEYMLDDSAAKAVITTGGLWKEKKLDFPEEKVIFIDEARQNGKEVPVCSGLNADSPAMLLYTSGTTGNPKGVLHTHNMLLSLGDYIKIHEDAAMNEDTRSGIMSSFPFIATQTFLMGPLVNGGTVCIVPDEARKDMGYLYDYICTNNITHIFLPSSLAAILTEDYDTSDLFIFSGGEKLRNFKPNTKGSFLINSYGCTETGGLLSKKIYGDEERISVGKPWINTKAVIVDEQLKEVKSGDTGELLITNAFMSRGYHGLAKLSHEKWISINDEIWFRTGDRACMMPDGSIDLLGRTDNMVKLRGFRIETGEVETQVAAAVLRAGRDDVGQIVVVVKSIGGAEHLTCYYEAGEELDNRVIEEEVSEYLTPYMVPDVWVRMDSLPRNVNGKVLRKELPQPKRKCVTDGALDTEVLARLIYTAADVIKTDCVLGAGDRFTDIGGTSLNAMQYTSLLREQGIKISASDVLTLNEFRKIAEAAEVAYEHLWSQEEYDRIRSDFAKRGEHIIKVLPISSKQDDMLFRQLIYPDETNDMNLLMLQVESTVSEEVLREALDVISDENEELRSAIVFRDVSVIQQVITDRRIPLDVVEEGCFGKQERERLRERLVNENFDLQFGSMMKVLCVHIDVHGKGMSCLYILTHQIMIERELLRKLISRLMELLYAGYPDDVSIRDWRYILESEDSVQDEDIDNANPINSLSSVTFNKNAPGIRVYSENAGPKIVFVHTANTGSEAYYRLAGRIGGDISFSVIEPFNLYHPDEACYGIRNIAEHYIGILKAYIPDGPYILGGWCYGGIVAHEMACQLEQRGEEVKHLFMMDSHAVTDKRLREESKNMFADANREYFETCPLFAELRENGMLEALIDNAAHVSDDLLHFTPSFFHGDVTYFKPDQVPAGASGESLRYWKDMMGFAAGNYENHCSRDRLNIIHTPHEHDLMMDDPSLDVIVPEICRVAGTV